MALRLPLLALLLLLAWLTAPNCGVPPPENRLTLLLPAGECGARLRLQFAADGADLEDEASWHDFSNLPTFQDQDCIAGWPKSAARHYGLRTRICCVLDGDDTDRSYCSAAADADEDGEFDYIAPPGTPCRSITGQDGKVIL